MITRILRFLSSKGHINILIPRITLWCLQVGIEIAGHQQIGPVGTLADGCKQGLYGQGIIWVNILPCDIPPLPSQLQLKVDDVSAVEVECLQSEVLRLAGEHGDAVAVMSRRLGRQDNVYSWLPCVDPLGNMFLLK